MRRIFLILICLLSAFTLFACGKDASVKENEGIATDTKEEVVEDQIPKDYVMAIVVTINPKVKLYLDANSKIIGVEYLNEDAKTAFSEISFSGMTVEEGMEKIVGAAVETQFLTDGKDVNIDILEVRDASCDSASVCEEAGAAATKAVASKKVNASVSSQVVATTEAVTKEAATTETAITEAATTEAVTEAPVSANPCSNCGGTGKCDECLGSGYRGAGYAVSCPRCHGSLTETCIYCDAAGNSNKHAGTCDFPNCMGAHVYACTTCNGGTKLVTCASCNGNGKCKVCGGSGTQ
ncbi:MAG: hypothetical protein Q4F06_05315 [Eubacteriales bacterium]|nr:hypothetical protein [Eubacteriales bacterium]